MALNDVGAAGSADPQVIALIQGISHKRVAVAASTSRFAAASAKSDALEDEDITAPAKWARESTKDEDARF